MPEARRFAQRILPVARSSAQRLGARQRGAGCASGRPPPHASWHLGAPAHRAAMARSRFPGASEAHACGVACSAKAHAPSTHRPLTRHDRCAPPPAADTAPAGSTFRRRAARSRRAQRHHVCQDWRRLTVSGSEARSGEPPGRGQINAERIEAEGVGQALRSAWGHRPPPTPRTAATLPTGACTMPAGHPGSGPPDLRQPSPYRRAHAWDNAPTKRLFKPLKIQSIDRVRPETRAQARLDIDDGIEGDYHRRRLPPLPSTVTPRSTTRRRWSRRALLYVKTRPGPCAVHINTAGPAAYVARPIT